MRISKDQDYQSETVSHYILLIWKLSYHLFATGSATTGKYKGMLLSTSLRKGHPKNAEHCGSFSATECSSEGLPVQEPYAQDLLPHQAQKALV